MKNNKKRDWFRSIAGIVLSIAVIFLSWAAVSWASLANVMEVKHIKILNHHFISENDYRLIVEKYVNNESNTILTNCRISFLFECEKQGATL